MVWKCNISSGSSVNNSVVYPALERLSLAPMFPMPRHHPDPPPSRSPVVCATFSSATRGSKMCERQTSPAAERAPLPVIFARRDLTATFHLSRNVYYVLILLPTGNRINNISTKENTSGVEKRDTREKGNHWRCEYDACERNSERKLNGKRNLSHSINPMRRMKFTLQPMLVVSLFK